MYYLTTNKILPDANREEIMKTVQAHILWTKNMISEGIVLQAGKWGETGGMAIIKARDIDEAKRILNEDPLIKAGLVDFELERFYPDVSMEG